MKASVLALSGGVGGAKLALGLSTLLAPDELTIVANTGDDFEHFGLPISPDLDTVMYTLAGIANPEQGWGIANESWAAMEMLASLGGETWFRLGDRDLATHLVRGQWLRSGKPLAAVTEHLCHRLGIRHRLLPMSNDPVRTMVATESGEMPFQQYFVHERCGPAVKGFRFAGSDRARPDPLFIERLRSPDLTATVICPSNPFVSVAPMLQLPGVEAALRASGAPVVAVSPIVAEQAIKGPTAKMMAELNMPVTATAVATHYGNLLSGFVIDESDRDQADGIRALGIAVMVAPTVMHAREEKIELAQRVLEFVAALSTRPAPCMR